MKVHLLFVLSLLSLFLLIPHTHHTLFFFYQTRNKPLHQKAPPLKVTYSGPNVGTKQLIKCNCFITCPNKFPFLVPWILATFTVLLVSTSLPGWSPHSRRSPAASFRAPTLQRRRGCPSQAHPLAQVTLTALLTLFTHDNFELDDLLLPKVSNYFQGIVSSYFSLMNKDVFFCVVPVYKSLTDFYVETFQHTQKYLTEQVLFLSCRCFLRTNLGHRFVPFSMGASFILFENLPRTALKNITVALLSSTMPDSPVFSSFLLSRSGFSTSLTPGIFPKTRTQREVSVHFATAFCVIWCSNTISASRRYLTLLSISKQE